MEKHPTPPLAATPHANDGGILVTGATGFLGRQILNRLLARNNKTIYILMRDQNVEMARARLDLAKADMARIRIVSGDIAAPRLGVNDADWQDLANNIDTIVHMAATVNMAMDYQSLETANTSAVHHLLLLMATGRQKHLHHASTLSVFVATDQNSGIAREDDDLAETTAIYGGYAQSKWAAEILLHAARKNGFDITLHRLGLVTGDSRTGAFSSHDFLRTFLLGLTALGHIPVGDHRELLLDVTPVDYAADMVCAAISANAKGNLHIANHGGFSLAQLTSALARAGHSLLPVSTHGWSAWVANHSQTSTLSPEEAAALMGMCRALPPPAFDTYRAMDLFQATGIVFDDTRIKEQLGPHWRPAPAADDRLLDLYIKSFSLPPTPAKNRAMA